MSSKNNHTKGVPSQPGSIAEPVSPFLDEELFSDAELAESETINTRLEAFQLESPFLSPFEKAVSDDFGESDIEETEEFEGYLDDDNVDEELEEEEDFLEESDIEGALDEEIEEFQDEDEYEEYGDYLDDDDVDEEEEQDEEYIEETDIEDALDEEIEGFQDENEYEESKDYLDDEDVDEDLEKDEEFLEESGLEDALEKESEEFLDELEELKFDGEGAGIDNFFDEQEVELNKEGEEQYWSDWTAEEQEGPEIEGQQRKKRPWAFGGAFGQAFRTAEAIRMSVPKDAKRLLSYSKIFRGIARDLDKRYVSWDLTNTKAFKKIHWAAKGFTLRAPKKYRGRRFLYIGNGDVGSFFQPAEAAPKVLPTDSIMIRPPSWRLKPADQLGEWVRRIAHESSHAYNRFQRERPAPTTYSGIVRAAINEEIRTRQQVIKILREIKRYRRARRLLKGYSPTICADRSIVERDYFPSKYRTTYLEFFALSALMNDASKNLTKSQQNLGTIDKAVDAVPFVTYRGKEKPKRRFYSIGKSRSKLGANTKYGQLDYAKVRFDRRLISARWRLFDKRQKIDNKKRDKERRYQFNATKFLRGITYSPVSKKATCVVVTF